MKRITLLFTSLLLSIFAFSQSHNWGVACRYSKNFRYNSEQGCPACNKERADENKARQDEDKRRADVAAAKEKARKEEIQREKEAADLRAKEEEEKRKMREQAEKDYQNYKDNREKYINEAKIESTKKYPGYDPEKAKARIPGNLTGVVLFDNRPARRYEIKRGNTIIKTYSYDGYTLMMVDKFIIVKDEARKINSLSILDNKGDILKVGDEMYFESIRPLSENNTIEFVYALSGKEELIYSMSGGVYKSERQAKTIENVIMMEGAEIIAKRKAAGDNTTYLAGFGSRYGFSAKRIITGLDLSVLENSKVYIVQ